MELISVTRTEEFRVSDAARTAAVGNTETPLEILNRN
jgi:hypothetical protein